MTDEQRQEIERLDCWLAVQEVMGRRFYWVSEEKDCDLPGECSMNAYATEQHGIFGAGDLPLSGTVLRSLYAANDASGGNPAAVRAKLHKMFPFLTETPAPTEVTHV